MEAEKYLKEKGYYHLPECVPVLMEAYAQEKNDWAYNKVTEFEQENEQLKDIIHNMYAEIPEVKDVFDKFEQLLNNTAQNG